MFSITFPQPFKLDTNNQDGGKFKGWKNSNMDKDVSKYKKARAKLEVVETQNLICFCVCVCVCDLNTSRLNWVKCINK